MIPVSSKEFVEYKDSDGVVYKFKPKTGTVEGELFEVYQDGLDYNEQRKRFSDFFDKIFIGPTADYNNDEKTTLLKFWHEANKLTVEEKKS